jgi:site-specific DNA recombinase
MAVGAEAPSLLAGLIFDSDGAVKKGKRYRYYVSTALITRSRSEHPKGRRIPAGDIEGLVLDRLRALFASGAEVSGAVAPLGLDAATQRAVLDRSAKLAERWAKLASLEIRERVRSLVQQIQIGEAQILVWLNRTAIVSSVMPDAPLKPTDCVFRPVDHRKPSPGWQGCAAGDRQWHRETDRRRSCLPDRPSGRNAQHVPCGP